MEQPFSILLIPEQEHIAHHHFGNVALLSVLIVVTAVYQLTFHGQLLTLLYIFLYYFGSLSPGSYIVPLRIGYLLAFVVVKVLVGGNNKPGKFFTGFKNFDLRVAARVAY